MKLSTTIILSLGCVNEASAWHHATNSTLQKALRSEDGDYTLVAFTHPDHQASQALEPEWNAVQETVTDGLVLSIDCAAEPNACKEHDIASFPAIRLFHRHGHPERRSDHGQGKRMDRYRGPRRAPAIRSFVARVRRPTVSTIMEQNLTSFMGTDDVVFVLQYRRGDEVAEKPAENPDIGIVNLFEVQAERYGDRYSFGLMSNTDNERPIILCSNKVNGIEMALDARDSLYTFVKQCSTPLIPELTRGNELEYSSQGKSFVHYFVANPKERDEYVAEMLPLAKKYAEYLQFTTIDVNEYPEMLPVYGQRPGSSKVLSVYHPSNGQIFPYQKTLKASAAAVERFLLDIIEGKAKPWSGELAPGKDAGHEEL